MMDSIIQFIHRCASDITHSPGVVKGCIGLIGDLGQLYGVKMNNLARQNFVDQLIHAGMQDEDMESIAEWTQSVRFISFLYFYRLL